MAQAATAARPTVKGARPTAPGKSPSAKAGPDAGAVWTYSRMHVILFLIGVVLIIASFALMKLTGDISVSVMTLWVVYTIFLPFALLWDPKQPGDDRTEAPAPATSESAS